VDEKRFRFDLLVALLALVISAVAAGASAYQTYVIRKQFSATVWPYLTFVTSSSGTAFELDITNDGIGPALIYGAAITRDGKVIERQPGAAVQPPIGVAVEPERSEAKLDARRSGEHGTSNMTSSTLLPGDVISAGEKFELLRVEGKFFARRVVADFNRVDVALCYCSLLGDCWSKRLNDTAIRPRPVRSC
jgi:hypothetical protein